MCFTLHDLAFSSRILSCSSSSGLVNRRFRPLLVYFAATNKVNVVIAATGVELIDIITPRLFKIIGCTSAVEGWDIEIRVLKCGAKDVEVHLRNIGN